MALIVSFLLAVPGLMRPHPAKAQSIPQSNVPVQVPGFSNAIAVAAGDSGSMALTSTGQVWCWGLNNLGQLGNGTTGGYSAVPVNVSSISSISAIACGTSTRLALTSSGKVYRWGEVGNNVESNLPQSAPGLHTGTIAIASGTQHCMALKSDGTVYTFGLNQVGQLGDGTTTDNYTPHQVPNLFGVIKIAAGSFNCFALKSDGTVWAWGSNRLCALGNGDCLTSFTTSPTQVAALPSIASISSGQDFGLAVTPDLPGSPGRMYGWGSNFVGNLGDNTYVESRKTAVICPTLQGVTKAVSGAASNHTLIMLSDGSVWACGDGAFGQLGCGEPPCGGATPVSCNGLGYTNRAVDIAAGFQHSLAVLSNGTVWAWGRNLVGQLGVG